MVGIPTVVVVEAKVVAVGASMVEAVLLPQKEAPLNGGGTVHKVLFVGMRETGDNDDTQNKGDNELGGKGRVVLRPGWRLRRGRVGDVTDQRPNQCQAFGGVN